MGDYSGMGLLGFGSAENDEQEYQPNRRERRAMAKKLKAQQRRGQRAYERTRRNQEESK